MLILVTLAPIWLITKFWRLFKATLKALGSTTMTICKQFEKHLRKLLEKLKKYPNFDNSHPQPNSILWMIFGIVFKTIGSRKRAICENFEKNKGNFQRLQGTLMLKWIVPTLRWFISIFWKVFIITLKAMCNFTRAICKQTEKK